MVLLAMGDMAAGWKEYEWRWKLPRLDVRVDATADPGAHIGPVRMRKADTPVVARAEVLRQANEAAARDPEQVLAALTCRSKTSTS
jgi:hypothetical protein